MTSDADDRQRQASDPAVSAWVSASAGTGKTKVLTDRILRLLLAGVAPERLLCLTFTRAAAAEMANRLNRELARWAIAPTEPLLKELQALTGRPVAVAQAPVARQLLARVLETPGGMRIQTIHAFCQSVLARFPIEADISPHFAVVDERSASEMLAMARDELFDQIQQGGRTDLEADLATIVAHIHETRFPELLSHMLAQRPKLAAAIKALGGAAKLDQGLARLLDIDHGADEASVIADACRDDAFDLAGLTRAVDALRTGKKSDVARGDGIARWLAAGPERQSEIDIYASIFLTREGKPRKVLATKDLGDANPRLLEVMAGEAERLIWLANQRRKAIVVQATGALIRLSDALIRGYGDQKAMRSRVDYEDLIVFTESLVGPQGMPSWVLYKLDGGIDHILVDEAQDTNPEQWRIIESIADEFFAGAGARDVHRTVFAVGDPKQSIYSFQRADPDAFDEMRRRFAPRSSAADGGWADVELDVSFRSTAAVLQAVDAVFGAAAADGVVPPGARLHHESARDGAGGLVEIWPPIVPPLPVEIQSWQLPVAPDVDLAAPARLAQLIAARIEVMCSGGEQLESQGRSIRPGDIMVLVRRRTGFVEDLIRALKTRSIAVAGVDRLVLGDHIAVQDLVALGRFLLMPDDDLQLAVVLKGPLIGMDDDQLFGLAHGRVDSLWAALRQHHDASPIHRHAFTMLRELLGLVDLMPPHELYATILGAYGGRHALVGRLGPEAGDPIDEFQAQTLAYQESHPSSLEGFLHWFETGAVEIKRDLEHGTVDAVRVMTVHGAKGLEAPIVFLPDTMQVPRHSPLLLWVPGNAGVLWPPRVAHYDDLCRELRVAADLRQAQEYRRLLYVAMTRAEDRFYVCGWETNQTTPDDCWYHLVRNALSDDLEAVDDPSFADLPFAPSASVWRLQTPQTASVAGPPDKRRATVPPLPAWINRPAPDEPATFRPMTPSRMDEPTTPIAPIAAHNAQAALRGRAIHRLLERLPDVPAADRGAVMARYLAMQYIDADMGDDIARAVQDLLNDPTYAALFDTGSRAEVAFTAEVNGRGGPVRIAGQIDRLCWADDGLLIVDYKTGGAVPATPEAAPVAYIRQMAAYRAAFREIYPDRPIRCGLLWTAGPRLDHLPEDLLAVYAP